MTTFIPSACIPLKLIPGHACPGCGEYHFQGAMLCLRCQWKSTKQKEAMNLLFLPAQEKT